MAARETKQEKLIRMIAAEEPLMRAGHIVAGIDEVGRGPLAGPVVTACVATRPDAWILGVDDSKKLSEKRREELYPLILQSAIYAKTAWIWPEEIDEINILNATRKAMEQCAAGLENAVFFVDAVTGLNLPGEMISLIKGDSQCYAIAAASVMAKVERDRYMVEIDKEYPQYGFARNKGYGTAEHIRALKEFGPCPYHRRSFIRSFV